MSLKNILITGATGHQGGACIMALQSLSPKQFNIFALTRNSSSASALKLANRGIMIIQGDIAFPDSVFKQIPSLYGLFLVTVPGPHEKDYATSFIDAATAEGVHNIVFTSVDRDGPIKSETDEPMVIPHFGFKRDIEKHLKTSAEKTGGKVIWTILRPTSFMNNLAPGFVGRVAASALKQMGDTRISLISVRDIGRVAARAFERPDEFGGRAMTLTGDLLTFVSLFACFQCTVFPGRIISVSTSSGEVQSGLKWIRLITISCLGRYKQDLQGRDGRRYAADL
jgi:uncharacterized protein YbjT (DUF2867 family)